MLAVCVLFAAFVACLADNGPCAYPPQWEAYFGERMRVKTTATGVETMLIVMGNMYADQVARKAAVHYVVYHTTPIEVTVIADFNAHGMVVIYPGKQQCARVLLPQEMNEQGVALNATHLSTFRWGHANNAVLVSQWQSTLTVQKPWPSTVDFYQMVTVDECVPVVEQGTNHLQGTEVFFDASFANFNTTITNPNAFVPPEYCRDAPVIENPGALVEGFMMRFIKY